MGCLLEIKCSSLKWYDMPPLCKTQMKLCWKSSIKRINSSIVDQLLLTSLLKCCLSLASCLVNIDPKLKDWLFNWRLPTRFHFGSMCAGREARDKQRVGELVSNNWNGKANTQVHKHCRLVRPKSLPLRSFGIESGDWIEVKRLIKTSKRGL